MSESRGQNLPVPVRADPDTLRLVRHAQKAERYDTLVFMLKEIEILEGDVLRHRRSRSKMAAMTILALEAKITELRLLISTIIAKDVP
jgi:hypothetical protein